MSEESAPKDEPQVQNVNTTVICPECGELIEVNDIRALLLANHMARYCEETAVWLHD